MRAETGFFRSGVNVWKVAGASCATVLVDQLTVLLGDRIYCCPGRALISSFVDPSARSLSDHLPVIADLVMSARSAGRDAALRAGEVTA